MFGIQTKQKTPQTWMKKDRNSAKENSVRPKWMPGKSWAAKILDLILYFFSTCTFAAVLVWHQ